MQFIATGVGGVKGIEAKEESYLRKPKIIRQVVESLFLKVFKE